ncbi:class II aldolase/adducin family protein [Sphingomonas sp. AOB5]|uniref:class II aldolase/adducin family protein n=1 Tax=Sphingomonas sp. AOB5 TaxID=3034017 RepID=UPI0023F9CBF9|nr:class II aldolase/adducin family protein [Sphingomonas sp. AOB5]MDF7774853.1 class II aldolase/adducin family protein [Sphingomonas sp. AOB5]
MDVNLSTRGNVAAFRVMDAFERQRRIDLAAAYRLVAMFGWDDLLATHLSANLPDEEAFLVNPVGMMFEEITASSLVKVNLDGEIISDTPYSINRAGFVIHSAVHGARPDAGCVMHLHTRDGVAVSALEGGLLPLNQTSMILSQAIARHEYEGVALEIGERERLVADLGSRNLMLLSNHGTLALGGSVAEAFLQMYMLEWACTVQVRTLSMGQALHAADPAVIDKTAQMLSSEKGAAVTASYADQLVWPALLRKLDRTNPGYADL